MLSVAESNGIQQTTTDIPFLKFYLNPQTPVLLPMVTVQQVLAVSARRLTGVPNMPDFILGLLNQRNNLYWVVDLPLFLGFPGVNIHAQVFNLAILNAQVSPVGLAVHHIEGVVRSSTEAIASHSLDVSLPQLSACVCGYMCLGEETLPVLDPTVIAKDRRLCPSP